jgi:hypothetical protein
MFEPTQIKFKRPRHAPAHDTVAARRVDHAIVHACAHAEAMKGPPARGGCVVGTVLRGEVMCTRTLGRCHAAFAHTPVPTCTHRHWLEPAARHPPPPRPCRNPARRLVVEPPLHTRLHI